MKTFFVFLVFFFSWIFMNFYLQNLYSTGDSDAASLKIIDVFFFGLPPAFLGILVLDFAIRKAHIILRLVISALFAVAIFWAFHEYGLPF